jgi:hypothetical protein
MKKRFILFFGILCYTCTFLQSQVPYIEWARSYGGSGMDDLMKITQTRELGYIAVGTTYSKDGDVKGNLNQKSIWVLKLGVYGDIEWQRDIEYTLQCSQDYMDGVSVIQCLDGGYLVVGERAYYNFPTCKVPNNIAHITKLSKYGALEWTKSMGNFSHSYLYDIIQTNDSNYVAVGTVVKSNGHDGWIIKLNTKGDTIAQRFWGGNDEDFFSSVVQNTGKGFLVLGGGFSTNGDLTGNTDALYGDYWLVSYDDSLRKNGSVHYGGCGDQSPVSIKKYLNSGSIAAGRTWKDTCSNNINFVQGNHGSTDFWVIANDSLGVLQWQKCFGGSGGDYLQDMGYAGNNNYVLAGSSTSTDGDVLINKGSFDAVILKVDSTGKLVWQKSLGGSAGEDAKSIQQTLDGGFIVGCSSSSNDQEVHGNHGGMDFWVVKLSAGGVGFNSNYYETGFEAYPNPATSELTLISQTGAIGQWYKFFDMSGRLVLEGKLAGAKTTIDIKDLSAGVYTIVLEGTNSRNIKMVKY